MLLPGSALPLRAWQLDQRRRYPEWWVGVLVGAAWLVLLIAHRGHLLPRLPFIDPAGDGHRHGTEATSDPGSSFGYDLWYWALMSIAMMVPVTFPALRYVVLNSFPYRRTRALAVFLIAFNAIWIGLGLGTLIVVRAMRTELGVSGTDLIVVGLIWATFWQLTPIKRRALIACGRAVPLRPIGRKADISCARYGAQQGWRCIRSCGPLMGLMALAGHTAMIWMVGLTAYVIVEEVSEQGLKLLQPSAVILAIVLTGVIVA
jgi:predicted metal-binding membrane protein